MPLLKELGVCLIRFCYEYLAPNGAYVFAFAHSTFLTTFASLRLCVSCLCVMLFLIRVHPRCSSPFALRPSPATAKYTHAKA
jgi:hypothetical protein